MLDELVKTYKDKRVFLTGHTGFKGSWLLKILNILGADVKGYALEPYTDNDLFRLIDGERVCNSVIADIRDSEKLVRELCSFKPDFVFHLAAQPLVRLSYKIPAETFHVNAIGTANVLDAVRVLANPCNVVLITTDKVYHNYEWVYPYREDDRLGGYDPYSASKACSELVIDSYRNSFFNINEFSVHKKAIAVGRAGNVIGGGDWSTDRIIPDIIRALYAGTEIVVRNPNAVRPWQHVLEPLFGYLLLGSKLSTDTQTYSQAFNFGPEVSDALPVSELVQLSMDCWGGGQYAYKKEKNQPHEAGLLKLDISKAKALLNWQPSMNANTAIKATVNWYKQYKDDPGQINLFTECQIRNFLEEIK